MATLKNLVDETTNIKNELVECHSNLKNNLIEKGIECSDTDKMSSLIDKVNLLEEPMVWLYESGNGFSSLAEGYTYTSKNNKIVENIDDDCINFSTASTNMNNNGYDEVTFKLSRSIDLTKYSVIGFEVVADLQRSSTSVSNGAWYVTFGVQKDGSFISQYKIAGPTTSTLKQIIYVDASSITGNNEIVTYLYNYNMYTTMKVSIYKIWLE